MRMHIFPSPTAGRAKPQAPPHSSWRWGKPPKLAAGIKAPCAPDVTKAEKPSRGG
jgi:hypothetical protein